MNLNSQLSGLLDDLQNVGVESTLILGAILLLISGLIKKSSILTKTIYSLTLLIALYFNWLGFEYGVALESGLFLSVDSQVYTGLFLLVGLLILLYNRSSEHATEFYFFVLSMLAGGIFMMKANSFLVIYLSVELASLVGYILTNFTFKKSGHEAGIKYLLFGAVSSAIMLLGFGMVHGATATFFITDWQNEMEGLVTGVGLLFILFGLLFKASIVPFHIWVPAAYQSAPNDATAILSIVPKIGALVLIGRMFDVIGTQQAWLLDLCLILGAATIVFGTLSALRQTNVRRMISFGAIAHSGFLLPLVLIGSETAAEVFWWYATVYSVMNLAVFYLLDHFESKGLYRLSDYVGLGDQLPLLGVTFTIVLVSLIGLPPLAGFTAKLLLFTSLWEHYQVTGEWLMVTYLMVAVFATVASLFFYLRIPYQLFLVKAETSRSIECSFLTKIIATLFSIVLLLLFFVPQILTVMHRLLSQTAP